MPSITFQLETVTPLFLSGADQAIAELRPPAFRGALRYWFRAIVGAYCWNNIAQLKNIESSLLGDAGESGGSKIIVRLKQVPDPLPFNSVRFNQDQDPGLSYLWFSMKRSGGRNSKPARQAIGVENPLKFSLSFSTRPNPTKSLKQQQKDLLIAANCFWLTVNLGGFGSRERRGAGSLRVTQIQCQDIDENELPKFRMNYKEDAVLKFLRGELSKARRNCYQLLGFDTENLPTIDQLPDLEICGKYTSRIYLLKEPYTSWQEVLEDIGVKYKNYRQNLGLEKRAIFGLPLKDFDMESRRPSPLRIKVIRSLDRYYCVLIQIKAKFPESSRIDNPNNPSYRSMNEFIASFSEDEIERVG